MESSFQVPCTSWRKQTNSSRNPWDQANRCRPIATVSMQADRHGLVACFGIFAARTVWHQARPLSLDARSLQGPMKPVLLGFKFAKALPVSRFLGGSKSLGNAQP